jgi:hypothetical protein
VVLATLNHEQIDLREAGNYAGTCMPQKSGTTSKVAEFVMYGTLSDAQFQRLIDKIEEQALAVMRHGNRIAAWPLSGSGIRLSWVRKRPKLGLE